MCCEIFRYGSSTSINERHHYFYIITPVVISNSKINRSPVSKALNGQVDILHSVEIY